MGTFKDRHFIAENSENIEKHREEKYKLSINSTQTVTCPLNKDIKRIRLKSPENSISLEKVAEFQVISLLEEKKRDVPFYLKKWESFERTYSICCVFPGIWIRIETGVWSPPEKNKCQSLWPEVKRAAVKAITLLYVVWKIAWRPPQPNWIMQKGIGLEISPRNSN